MRCFEIGMEEEEEVRQRSMFKILFFLSRKDCLFLFLLSRRNETEDNDYNLFLEYALLDIYVCRFSFFSPPTTAVETTKEMIITVVEIRFL